MDGSGSIFAPILFHNEAITINAQFDRAVIRQNLEPFRNQVIGDPDFYFREALSFWDSESTPQFLKFEREAYSEIDTDLGLGSVVQGLCDAIKNLKPKGFNGQFIPSNAVVTGEVRLSREAAGFHRHRTSDYIFKMKNKPEYNQDLFSQFPVDSLAAIDSGRVFSGIAVALPLCSFTDSPLSGTLVLTDDKTVRGSLMTKLAKSENLASIDKKPREKLVNAFSDRTSGGMRSMIPEYALILGNTNLHSGPFDSKDSAVLVLDVLMSFDIESPQGNYIKWTNSQGRLRWPQQTNSIGVSVECASGAEMDEWSGKRPPWIIDSPDFRNLVQYHDDPPTSMQEITQDHRPVATHIRM